MKQVVHVERRGPRFITPRECFACKAECGPPQLPLPLGWDTHLVDNGEGLRTRHVLSCSPMCRAALGLEERVR